MSVEFVEGRRKKFVFSLCRLGIFPDEIFSREIEPYSAVFFKRQVGTEIEGLLEE